MLLSVAVALLWVLISPQAILDLSTTRAHISYEIHNVTQPSHPAPFTSHLIRSLLPGMSVIPLLYGVVGMAWIFWRKRRTPELVLLPATCLFYYALIEMSPSKIGVDRERYALPCVPLLLLAGSCWVVQARRPSTQLRIAFAAVALAVSMVQTIALTRTLKRDTRSEAQGWLKKYAPQSSYTVLTSELYKLIPPGGQPLLQFNPGSIEWEPGALAGKADVLALSSFAMHRYEAVGEPRLLMRHEEVRRAFPYRIVFKRPAWARMGFHHPTIEIRTRERWSSAQVTAD